MIPKKRILPISIVLIFTAILIFLPFMTSGYMLRVLNTTMITYLCVLSIFIVFGLCGQISFAQAGFWGIGAYITAITTIKFGFNSIEALILSMLGTALIALVIGLILFRLKGHYFGFSTIGIVVLLNGLFENWTPVTGGADGVANIPSFGIGPLIISSEKGNYFLILLVVFIISAITLLIRHSSLGRSFMAIRDNEIAAKCMGINSFVTKNIAFVIGAIFCGISGAMFAFLTGYISATSFTFSQSSIYLVMLMVGGYSSIVGAVIGSGFLMLLPEWIRPLQNYIMLIFGAGVILLMVILPDGLYGGGKKLLEKLKGGKKVIWKIHSKQTRK
jgi:branched-chain amino acid transport system permease protein